MFDLNFRRKKEVRAVAGGNDALDNAYNRPAGGLKTIHINGMLTPIGDIATRKDLGTPGALVAIFNPGTQPHYVKFGNGTVTAPTGGADGIAVPPNSYVSLACGMDTYLIADGQCFAYLIEDDSYLAKQNGQQL